MLWGKSTMGSFEYPFLRVVIELRESLGVWPMVLRLALGVFAGVKVAILAYLGGSGKGYTGRSAVECNERWRSKASQPGGTLEAAAVPGAGYRGDGAQPRHGTKQPEARSRGVDRPIDVNEHL